MANQQQEEAGREDDAPITASGADTIEILSPGVLGMNVEGEEFMLDFRPAIFSNVVSIGISDMMVVLDFGFLIAGKKGSERFSAEISYPKALSGEVTRIVMPPRKAFEFLQMLDRSLGQMKTMLKDAFEEKAPSGTEDERQG